MAAWLESQFMQKYAYMHMPPILTLQPLKFVGRGILLGMCQTYQILNIITFIFKQLLAFMSLKEGGPFFLTLYQIYSQWFFTFIKLIIYSIIYEIGL